MNIIYLLGMLNDSGLRGLMRRFLLCLLVTVQSIALASCTQEKAAPCSAGARICEGDNVLLCQPDTETFKLEASCDDGEVCSFGACEPFVNPDLDQELARSQGTDDTGNSSLDPNGAFGERDDDGTDGGSDGSEGDAQGSETDNSNAVCGNGVLEGSETCDPLIVEGQGVCPTLCEPSTEPCIKAVLLGSFSTCDAVCENVPITDPIDADGCCPWGQSGLNDSDCSGCGNGVLDVGESCDSAIPQGGYGACPESCPETVGCTTLTLVGNPLVCTAECAATAVTEAIDGDGCCPAGMADTGSDTDCSVCGDGILEGAETCEVGLAGKKCPESCLPSGDPCVTVTLSGNSETCSALCESSVEILAVQGDGCCPAGLSEAEDLDCAETCGDGVATGTEACDGEDFASESCQSVGYPEGGVLFCGSDCTLSDLGCQGSHPMVYEKGLNLTVTDDITRVRWHPSGDYALMLGQGGKIIWYQPESGSVAILDTLDATVSDIDVSPDGAFFLVSGHEDFEARLWRVVSQDDGVFEITLEAEDFSGEPTAVAASPDGSRWVVAAQQANYINMLHIWSDGEGITKTVGYNASGGVMDVMWGYPSLYGGAETLITSDGENGADSNTYILDNDDDTVLSAAFPGGYGNPGGAAWRPGGQYGFLMGWSSNKIYVYDGTWQKTELPGVGTAASPNAVGWKADGTRALVVGRPIGTPLSATVVEYRPLSKSEYDPNGWVNISIGNYDELPWAGSSNAHLLSVDWRPQSPCDEGLIVGADSGPSFAPTLGAIIRFYDQDDPDCAPMGE